MLLANIVPEEKRLAHAAPNEPRSEALLVVGVICEEETVPKNDTPETLRLPFAPIVVEAMPVPRRSAPETYRSRHAAPKAPRSEMKFVVGVIWVEETEVRYAGPDKKSAPFAPSVEDAAPTTTRS